MSKELDGNVCNIVITKTLFRHPILKFVIPRMNARTEYRL
jgi:hypothetical protein